MLLEEAIKHCEEKALCGDACGLEHKQLADWLRKLIKVTAKIEELESVIAEKYKEISKLEELIADGDKDFEMAEHQNERLLKIIQHQKFKRCLNKAEWCEERCARYDLLQEHSGFSWRREIDFYFRWHCRWLDLAEKFKDGV